MKSIASRRIQGIQSLLGKVRSSREINPKERALMAEIRRYKRPPGMSDTQKLMAIQLARMLEGVIKKIWMSTPNTKHRHILNHDEMREICLRTRELLLLEPCFLKVEPPITIVGDVHGQLYDMLEIMNFLRFPQEIYLLRGNHETRCVNRQYGFYDECKRKFPRNGTFSTSMETKGTVLKMYQAGTSKYSGIELWTTFQHVFNCLPVAALVGSRIFCAHGGISEDLVSFKQFESYEFFADRKCLTLFSAPCYCGELDNQAAVLQVGSRLECRVLTFKKEVKPAATPRGVSCEDGYAALRTSQSQNPTTDEGTKVTQSPAETPILRTAEDTDSQEKGKQSAKWFDTSSMAENTKIAGKGQKQSKEQRNEKK
ncbi:Ser/Thr phosphatase family protein [Ancylostoma ceylanicum]|uniref:Serine/threonine-protein phosphatase n=1 Tax=Ancylostoma ceylanicum TaxID=53326 RepID=A0A0D6LSK2_9BILA|nr:Ser/Thr phosphatase family protein [Ancylostoma ceylanicum]